MAAAKAAGGDAVVAHPVDRDAFTQPMHLTALRVPATKCQQLMKQLRGYTLDKPRMKCIVHDGDSKATRLLLLAPGMDVAGLPAELQAVVEAEGLQATAHTVALDYSHFTHDQVLKKLLPEGVEAPTSFECIGHIAHLNLRDECLPFKHTIGQVILDKHPHIKTVINKVGSIENEYRVFELEVLAGERRLEAEVKQHAARFRLDLSQVYWNSRLETEHHRLVALFGEGEVVADAMAGIGPFAIPAALKGCTVYANDLNPASAHWLRTNIRLNKAGARVHAFNCDARAFLRLLLAAPPAIPPAPCAATAPTDPSPTPAAASEPSTDASAEPTAATAAAAQPSSASVQEEQATAGGRGAAGEGSTSGRQEAIPEGFAVPAGGLPVQHVVMNLPASAVEFVDAFRGAFDPAAWAQRPLPLVHCYTFQRASETDADIVRKVEGYLGGPLDAAPDIHVVRDVAPNKIMLCVSFRVPRAVAFCGRGPAGAAAVQQPGAASGGEEAAEEAAGSGLPNKKARTGDSSVAAQ